MELPAVTAFDLTPLGIEEDEEGIVAVDFLRSQSHNSVQNEEFTHHPLFAFLSVLFGAPIVDVDSEGDGLVFRGGVHGVVHVVAVEQLVLLVGFEDVFEQIAALSVLEEPLSVLGLDQPVAIDDALVFPEFGGGLAADHAYIPPNQQFIINFTHLHQIGLPL